MRPPSDVPDRAVLLAWAARLRSCGEVARAGALSLRSAVDSSGLAGPAGDALDQLGGTVAGQLSTVAAQAAAAADGLVQCAHEAGESGS